jgi:hypothetical protein
MQDPQNRPGIPCHPLPKTLNGPSVAGRNTAARHCTIVLFQCLCFNVQQVLMGMWNGLVWSGGAPAGAKQDSGTLSSRFTGAWFGFALKFLKQQVLNLKLGVLKGEKPDFHMVPIMWDASILIIPDI